jgi:hypothetical protein
MRLRQLRFGNILGRNEASTLASPKGSSSIDDKMLQELQITIRQIRESVADACGGPAAKAVEQFAPSSLAVYDPRRYERSLERIMPGLSGRIILAIERQLSSNNGIEMRPSESLFEFMLRVSSKKSSLESIIAA